MKEDRRTYWVGRGMGRVRRARPGWLRLRLGPRRAFGTRLTRRPAVVVPDLRVALAAVTAGAGITVLPTYLCTTELDDGVRPAPDYKSKTARTKRTSSLVSLP
ncbi:hypothetical protein GCM10022254_57020 [Actinomadura meridiana]|uniref:LysR substrate-binding domain-containing protein n=1 Tax=Actinomadura meridiana TaxID=559626 RepID=A0ABP8CGB7_9ACTN